MPTARGAPDQLLAVLTSTGVLRLLRWSLALRCWVLVARVSRGDAGEALRSEPTKAPAIAEGALATGLPAPPEVTVKLQLLIWVSRVDRGVAVVVIVWDRLLGEPERDVEDRLAWTVLCMLAGFRVGGRRRLAKQKLYSS